MFIESFHSLTSKFITDDKHHHVSHKDYILNEQLLNELRNMKITLQKSRYFHTDEVTSLINDLMKRYGDNGYTLLKYINICFELNTNNIIDILRCIDDIPVIRKTIEYIQKIDANEDYESSDEVDLVPDWEKLLEKEKCINEKLRKQLDFRHYEIQTEESIEKETKELFEAVKSKDLDKVKEIMRINPYYLLVRDKNERGKTLLCHAASNGWIGGIDFLLKAGSLIDGFIEGSTYGGSTPLLLAALNNQLEAVKYLISKGADIEAKDVNKRTPLIWATIKGNLDVAKFLISMDADIEAKDKENRSSLVLAITNNRYEIFEYLITKGANIETIATFKTTPLFWAASFGYYRLAKLLISKGAKVNTRDDNGCTPLHNAAHHGRLEVAQLLIECGADVNAMSNHRQTPLMMASDKGFLDVTKLLVSKGGNFKLKDESGWTALMLAKRSNEVDVVNFLSSIGAKI